MGAILIVTVPETIMRSEWRGEAHGTIPNRSTSKREAKVAIISMAQQARPKVTGHSDDFRAQLKILSSDVVAIQPPGMWWMASAMLARTSLVLSLPPRSWWYFSHSWRSFTSLQTGDGICGRGGFTSTRGHPPDTRRASRAR